MPAVRLVALARRPRRTRAWCRPRSRCGCGRRTRSAGRGRGARPASDASPEIPSSMSPSEAITNVWWSTISWPGRLKRAASIRSASAIPTACEIPWPSGPVVTSMPGQVAVLGVAGGLRAELAELLDVVLEADVVAGQVQRRVQQHRRVPARQHEPVAVGPLRMARVVAHDPRVQDVGERRQRHRRPGWPEFAFCTASIDSVRIVSTHSSSSVGGGSRSRSRRRAA